MTHEVELIKTAITGLSPSELQELTEWYRQLYSDLWDEQIEHDARAGRLDRLAEQALAEYSVGHCTEL
jgi:hypothetical protein